MSGKFMSVKKLIIPTLTLVIIASQLCGCAATTQSELLTMLENGEAIEIEVASPAFAEAEQGEESAILWEELAALTTNETLRDSWDDALLITKTDTGKNGILYVDAEGKNDNNNTLRVALHNREFAKLFETEEGIATLSEGALNQYADLEADEEMKSVYMGINGYFNLLPDATPNYCNADTTLNRLEFMAMVTRAETPVQELEADSAFATAVGTNDLNIYAQEVVEDSYLDIESKSLNNMAANGSMTRGEAVYLLMSRYFADELANVDISSAILTDCKDGGDIASAQKFIEDGIAKEYWKSYELVYTLQNPDQGVPTNLYKALVLAESKGIITSETRFDEAITRAEAVEIIVNTLMQEKGIAEFTAKLGTVEGYEAPIEEDEQEPTNTGGVTVELEEGEYQGDSIYDQIDIDKAAEDVTSSDIAQQIIADFLKEHAGQEQSYVEVPGTIPADESTETHYEFGQGGELPPELQGNPFD